MARLPLTHAALAAALAIAQPVLAQDDEGSQLDEIVVTGTRISGDDWDGMPAVTLTRRADFLIQSIHISNDTRDADARKREIYDTLRALVADAAKHGLSLGYGGDFLIPVTAKDYQVPLGVRGSRPDTNDLSIYVKQPIGPTDDVAGVIAKIQAFIKNARLVGRTTVEAEGGVGLTVVNPERYRYDIIALIGADAKKMQATVGSVCKVNLGDLSSRVSWERTDIAELTLYIPYEVELVECQ